MGCIYLFVLFLLLLALASVIHGVRTLISNEFRFSSQHRLTGGPARMAGILCILWGVAMTPAFIVAMVLFAEWMASK